MIATKEKQLIILKNSPALVWYNFLQAIATKFGIKSFETMVQRWICNIALVLL